MCVCVSTDQFVSLRHFTFACCFVLFTFALFCSVHVCDILICCACVAYSASQSRTMAKLRLCSLQSNGALNVDISEFQTNLVMVVWTSTSSSSKPMWWLPWFFVRPVCRTGTLPATRLFAEIVSMCSVCDNHVR